MFWLLLGGIFFVILGIFLFFKPEMAWEIAESWKSYSRGDPSDLYLKLTKINGVIFFLVGIMALVAMFFA